MHIYFLSWWEAPVWFGHWGLTSAWRPPAATPMAGPPGVHTQPHSGWPDLGSNWSSPAALWAPALPGAGWHPSQHEATGGFPSWGDINWRRHTLDQPGLRKNPLISSVKFYNFLLDNFSVINLSTFCFSKPLKQINSNCDVFLVTARDSFLSNNS